MKLLEDEERYRGAAERAYGLMVERFLKKETNGTVSWEGTVKVGSLDRDGSYEVSLDVHSALCDQFLLTEAVLYECAVE